MPSDDDLKLLEDGLVSQQQMKPEEARAVIEYVADPVNAFIDVIEREREEQRKKTAPAATPADIRAAEAAEAAEQAILDEEKGQRLLRGSRLVLQEQGYPAESMDDREVAHHSGLDRQSDLLSANEIDAGQLDLAQRWSSLDADARQSEARFWQTTPDKMDKYVEFFVVGTPLPKGGGKDE